jgi:S-DNA-T family DNA segregation ATPase FtsK/SpoIIIE
VNRRLALVVANDSYRDEGLTSLFAPVHDAQMLRELLRDPEIGGFDPADILVNESKAEIERAIERLFLGAEPGDLVALYFSGHGVRSRGGRLHLAVGNSELKLLSSTSVSASFITDLIEESDASSTVVLLDCCYSGAFADGLKSDPQIDVGRELRAGRGTYVLTAANSVETADDGRPAAGGRPRTLSAFTEAVVRGLSTGAADVRGVGRITPNDLWEYVRQEVPSRTTRQTPTQYGYVEDEVHLANVRRAYPTATETGGLRVHLGDLLGPLTQTAEHGLRAEEWRGTGRLVVPIGQVFRGTERAEPVWLDLAHTDGHLLVVGRIGSGKSTLLRTLIGALALTHTPDEVRFYCLESGGNKLGSLRRLPSFARLAGDDQDEAGVVGDLLAEIQAVIDRRKHLFRQYEVDSATRFRVIRDNLPDGPHPDLFLIIDRWSEFAGHADRIRAIAAGGLEYGVHVVVAARGWRDIPDDLEELIHARIELGLGRASESHVDARLAEQIPVDRPGWALLRRSRFRIALPELRTAIGPGAPEQWDGAGGAGTVWAAEASDGALDLVERVAKAWSRMHEARPAAYPGTTLPATGATPPLTSPTILDLLGITDLTRTVPFSGDAARLRVPIGVDQAGAPVMLDLKQAAEGGLGPHGLLVGATGSGKSELLRTLVTALALSHDPTQLNIIFADFKGGAAYAPFARLPHTAGMVTNLAADLTLIDRLADAITGELIRRQELLRVAGNYSSARDYQTARAAGARLEPLPALLVICDEFVELISAAPQMIDLFVQIGRTGRSLGVHLLLATQRLDEGRLRGLDTHLSYRIALRTFTAVESRAVLGIPDAYELPRSPGHGYLRSGAEPAVRFLAATSFQVPPNLPPGAEALPAAELVARTLHDAHPAARRVWLPPLTERPALDALLGPVVIDPERGLTVEDTQLRGALRVPIGLVDKPYQQRQEPLWLAWHEAGHVAVVGGPRTGKSSLLRALVCGLALTHTPDEVQVYCLDFGGGTLGMLRDLPHVGGVAGRTEPEAVRRTVGDLTALLDERDPARWHGPPGQSRRFSAVFLAVDGWLTLRAEFEDLDLAIRQLLSLGPRSGIHVVASASRWAEFRMVNETLFGTRLELRLTEPAESAVGRKAAARVPLDRPGRGITTDGDQFIAAAPEVSTLDGGTPALVGAVAHAWPGRPAPRVRLLPADLPYADLDLAADAGNPLALPIGVGEADLRQVAVDFAAESHFLLFGDRESGKSNLLRVLAAGIANRLTPEQARILVVDHRLSLLGSVTTDHLIGYGRAAADTSGLIEELADALQRRLPGPDVTPQQLRDRSWWTGPECFVLVDDYDLVTAGQTNPLASLLEYLPQARDIGLHLVLARRSGGAGRALFDPVIQRLRDLSSAGMVLSGNRDEGVLIGDVRPRPLPPGRGWLVTRKAGTRLIQVAHLPPPP